MCGIAGKLDFRGRSVDRALLVRMGAALAHRGPDDENVYASGPVGLSQRRLSIIDLSESACAPLSNEDGTLWVVFNGEIYNFQALRADLVARGHRFATNSDTEVLVHLYQEYGDGFVARLRGMFAFAIWDERRQRLFAARDRLGKKPLTYLHNADGFWFASQAHAIAVDPEVVLEPDYAAIDLYFSRQYVPSPLSAFRGFRKLPPGHTLSCEANGELRIDRYWQPPAYSPGASRVHKEELQQELVRQLDEAVRLRLIADVPLGALLSGGIDSAAVVALMARNVSAPVKTYSIGFREL
jgi:asparagine synthase (glutamine-hydrolysing)